MDNIIKQLKEAEQKIRILFEITRFVSFLLSLQDVLAAIVGLLIKEFKLDACSIRLLDGDGILRIRSNRSPRQVFMERGVSFSPDKPRQRGVPQGWI